MFNEIVNKQIKCVKPNFIEGFEEHNKLTELLLF